MEIKTKADGSKTLVVESAPADKIGKQGANKTESFEDVREIQKV